MDVFLAALPAAISRIATAILLLSADKSAQKYIHLKFTFIIKQPLISKAYLYLLFSPSYTQDTPPCKASK